MSIKKRIFRILECVLLIILFVMFIFPFYWTLITSVKGLYEAVAYPPTFWPSEFHFENYAQAWKHADFAHFGKNSIFMSVGATIILMLSCTMAAYGFARFEFKGKKGLFFLMMADIVIPAQVIFLPIFVMYSKMKLLNTYASYFFLFVYSGGVIFFLRNAFKQVPAELVEAARLDGASEFSVMFRVMLPAVKPFMITQIMLSFISKWNGYFWIQTLTTNDHIRTLPIAMNRLSSIGEEFISAWNVTMAGNVMLMAPLLILYIFANRQIKVAFIGNGIK